MWPPRSLSTLPLSASPSSSLLLLLGLALCGFAAEKNITFDDTDASFTWFGEWNAITPSNPCGGCSSKPDDISQIYEQTWHDGNLEVANPEKTGGAFNFTGSAVYIFGVDQTNSQPDILFTVDSDNSLTSTHHYTGSESYAYNALFFSATGLAPDQSHTVNWVFDADPSTGESLQEALFDYAVVTSEVDDEGATPVTGDAGGNMGTGGSTGAQTGGNVGSGVGTGAGAGSGSSRSIASSTRAATANQSGLSPSTSVPQGSAGESQPTALKPSSVQTTSEPLFTVTSQSSNGSSSPSIGIIVGAVLAVLTVAVFLALIVCLWRRRRERKRHILKATALPFVLDFHTDSFPATSEKTAHILQASPQVPIPSASTRRSRRWRRRGGSILPSSSSPRNGRERMLEERVAQLEARIETTAEVTGVQPPPYIGHDAQ